MEPGETTRDYRKEEPIKEKYLKWIYCSHKCYLAKLWKHKISQKAIHKEYPYLFDHPFPNSFYAKSLNNYFSNTINGNNLGFVSFEAQIVKQADEIAQRQQDLEDGINQGLLPFKMAKDDVTKLIKKFNSQGTFQNIIDTLNNINNSKELGKLLAEFYKKALVNRTYQNVKSFASNLDIVLINIFNLMDILYSMDGDNDKKKGNWILEEFASIAEPSKFEDLDKVKCLTDCFKLDNNLNHVYLYFVSYDHLEKCTKQNEYSEQTIKILSACLSSLKIPTKILSTCKANKAKYFLNYKKALQLLKSEPDELAYSFIIALDFLRNYLSKEHPKENKVFFINEKKEWKTIGWLNLRSFNLLHKIYTENIKKTNGPIICISDFKDFNVPTNYNPADLEEVTKSFEIWKKILKNDANKVFGNLVTFTDKNDRNYTKKKTALVNFEVKQSNTILKSEPVEKNDGKASYILRRLFKAYITNSHQLPDQGLRYILITLINSYRDDKLEKLLESEKKACEEILEKLKKTTFNSTRTDDELENELKNIWEIDLLHFETGTETTKFRALKKGKSNEIIAALEKRANLALYFDGLIKKQDDIILKLNSEQTIHKDFIKELLRNLRTILDNSILNKTFYWESILTRGICDYIASLTDQEAVNEYEKLYAGIMEII